MGGVSRFGLVHPDLSCFVLLCPFWDFPDFSRVSRLVLFLFLGLLTSLKAPTTDSPERVCGTIRTFPEKNGNPPAWKPPGLAFPKSSGTLHCVAKGGRQKGIGKKVTKTRKRLLKSDQKREKGYQIVTEKECEWPTPFCLPPFAAR